MKAACGTVHKFGDNIDTDVIIPARYLNSSDPAELATHCMEDIDISFKDRVKPGDIMVELNGEVISNMNDMMAGLEAFREGDTVKVTVWRPDEVEDASQGMISREGKYIENIEVGLAMLDGIAQ